MIYNRGKNSAENWSKMTSRSQHNSENFYCQIRLHKLYIQYCITNTILNVLNLDNNRRRYSRNVHSEVYILGEASVQRNVVNHVFEIDTRLVVLMAFAYEAL